MVTATDLRHRITIESPREHEDDNGDVITVWDPVRTAFAKREQLRGSEAFAAQQRYAEVATRFVIRWPNWQSDDPGVSPRHRIRNAGKYYDVQEVLEVGNKEAVSILATARAESEQE